MKRLSFTLFAIVFIVFSVWAPQSRSQDTDAPAKPIFRAGAVTSNITPPLGELIVGGWKPIPATHVHDELYARCLVLDDGTTKLAIVLCDNVGIPREVFALAKSSIERATGLPKSHMLMASTHTHSATTARGPSKVLWQDELTDYQKFIASRISDGVQRALNQLEPAKIGWGTATEASEVFNRRWYVKDATLSTNPFGGVDQVRMNPPRGNAALDRPAGPTDPEISFITIQSVEGRPISLLANYSLHYVGGVRSGDVSADYFGYFAQYISDKIGGRGAFPPFVGMLSNGTSGDINNINFTKPSSQGKRYDRYEKMQEVAQKVASRVHESHGKVKFHDWVPLAAVTTELPLKLRKPTPEMTAHFEQFGQASPTDAHNRTAIYADRIAKLADAPEQINVPLQALRIGNIGVAAIPFETFAEIGLELKERAAVEEMFTIELANGSYGYLPTPRHHRLGGYETWLGTNYVEQEASTKIVDAVLNLFSQLSEVKSP